MNTDSRSSFRVMLLVSVKMVCCDRRFRKRAYSHRMEKRIEFNSGLMLLTGRCPQTFDLVFNRLTSAFNRDARLLIGFQVLINKLQKPSGFH